MRRWCSLMTTAVGRLRASAARRALSRSVRASAAAACRARCAARSCTCTARPHVSRPQQAASSRAWLAAPRFSGAAHAIHHPDRMLERTGQPCPQFSGAPRGPLEVQRTPLSVGQQYVPCKPMVP